VCRADWWTKPARTVSAAPERAAAPTTTAAPPVWLLYQGPTPAPAALRGRMSRRSYRVGAAGSVAVQPADVAAMIRTGWFTRDGSYA
jgi:hypothetical protein